MKIDIHTHTMKIKSGDSPKRNIESDALRDIIKDTDVKILAITNHNHFDLVQYEEIVQKTKGLCQIWPGVELDVVEDNRRGHLLIIVDPDNSHKLAEKMRILLKDYTFDNFSISIEEVINNFEELDSIYIPHYLAKKPCLNDEDIVKIEALIKNKNRLIKEATNSISAGIYISHGHKSIYGSDIQDWDTYVDNSESLPELRLPVESFNQFCLLLDKDEPTINTLLDYKSHDKILLEPFGSSEPICIDIYNDINILFGSKGTGKSEILKAISAYYNSKGLRTSVFESNLENLSAIYNIKGIDLSLSLENMNINRCSNEIKNLKNASEENITSLSNYVNFFSCENNNKRADSIRIKDYLIEDTIGRERKFEDVFSVTEKFNEFIGYLGSNSLLEDIIEKDLLVEMTTSLNKVLSKLSDESALRFIESKSSKFYNELIELFNTEISKKTGSPVKPSLTGFSKYASNRINLEKSVRKIRENLQKKIISQKEYVGNLGVKGELYCVTDIFPHDGIISNSKYYTLKGNKKTPQKDFLNAFLEIEKHIYSNDLFEKLSNFNTINGIEDIDDLDDLLLFNRYFAINQKPYTPSSGESSMLLLHKELSEDKEVYLLDEPEKSLGNDYINDVIVPLLKERAKMGKKIIIATHDANIAVRTLPYNSIYRKHEETNYSTFVGNPFSNNLININNIKDILNWKEISMKTLEGGKAAFGERGKIYGS